jgi:lysophospholipase L1-like esterase
MKFSFILILFTLLSFSKLCAQQSDSYKIDNNKHENGYNFIDQKFNLFQYSKKSIINNFVSKLLSAKNKKITIAHFGDSHVQLDYFSSTFRNLLDSNFGNSGRGLIFPFSIAKTYSHRDFTSNFTGKWLSSNSIQNPPKIPLGVSGFVANTKDMYANVTFKFNKKLDSGPYILYTYFKNDSDDYDIKISDYTNYLKKIDSKYENNIKIFVTDKSIDSLKIEFTKSSFDVVSDLFFYGLEIKKETPGVLYHNLGVGGASFNALNQQLYFDNQFRILNPDIVILDWGTNDIIYKNNIAEDLESTIIKTINRIRSILPNITIILTSVQDMNYKGLNISKAKDFSDLIRKISIQEDCIFYDWFYISGGRFSMKQWDENLLARKDNIHLTPLGYKVKAELFFNAIQKSIFDFKNNNLKVKLLLDVPIDTFKNSQLIIKNIKHKKSKNYKKHKNFRRKRNRKINKH